MSHGPTVATILICRNFMLREGLKHICSGTRYSVQLEAWTWDDKNLFQLPHAMPSLFIIDANLQPEGIADAVSFLKEQYPETRAVVLADSFDLDSMMEALQAGADGYCLATSGCETLIKYLDLVMLGEVVFPSAMFLSALSPIENAPDVQMQSLAKAPEAPRIPKATDADGSPIRTLSSREAEILQCLMQGAPNKVIARKLEVAEATVKVHIKAILRKIRVANRTQAAMWAVAHLSARGMEDSASAPR